MMISYLLLIGSIFLGVLSAAPALVEGVTHLTAFRGFAGTSVLIMVSHSVISRLGLLWQPWYPSPQLQLFHF